MVQGVADKEDISTNKKIPMEKGSSSDGRKKSQTTTLRVRQSPRKRKADKVDKPVKNKKVKAMVKLSGPGNEGNEKADDARKEEGIKVISIVEESTVIDVETHSFIISRPHAEEKLSNWRKSKVWKKVKDHEKQLFEEFTSTATKRTLICRSLEFSDISGKEVDMLMMNQGCDAEVINWWGRKVSNSTLNASKRVMFLPAHLFTMINHECNETTICRIVKEKLKECFKDDTVYYICAPMCHPALANKSKGDHWTLLVFNLLDQGWYHYNSLLCDRRSAKRCLENAVMFATKLETTMFEMRLISGSKNEKAKIIKEPLELQQGEFPDCGIYVMLHYEELILQTNMEGHVCTSYVPGRMEGMDWQMRAQRKRAEVSYKLLKENVHEWNREV